MTLAEKVLSHFTEVRSHGNDSGALEETTIGEYIEEDRAPDERTRIEPKKDFRDPFLEIDHHASPDLISGKVVDTSGYPIQNANIHIGRASLETLGRYDLEKITESSEARISTDNNGIFKYSIDSSSRYRVAVTKGGFVPIMETYYPGEKRLFVLKKTSGVVTFSVVDGRTSGAISAATVRMRYYHDYKGLDRTLQTDDEGKVELENFPDIVDSITIVHGDYEVVRLRNWPIASLHEKKIALTKNESTHNYVIGRSSSDGNPIGIMNIDAQISYADREGRHLVSVRRGEESERSLPVEIAAEGYCDLQLEIPGDSDGELYDFPMLPAAKANCRIVDDRGRPIPGVKIAISVDHRFSYPGLKLKPEKTASNDDGDCVMNWVPMHTAFRVRMLRDEYPVQESSEIVIDSPGNNHIGDMVFERVGRLVGQVVDENGKPVAGAWVGAVHPNNSYIRDITDEEGKYELHVDQIKKISVAKIGFMTCKEEYLEEIHGDQTRQHDILLRKSEKISGMVFDRQGEPVLGAVIRVQEDLCGKPNQMITDADGRFSIVGFEPGKHYHLRAFRTSNFPYSTSYDENSTVAAGREDVVLQVSGIGRIFGEVRDASGEILRGDDVVVWVAKESSGLSRDNWVGKSFSSGYYSLALEPGDWKLIGRKGGYSREVITVKILEEQEQNKTLWLKKEIALNFER